MPQRITITLPDSTYRKLKAWAEQEDRSIAGQASYLLQRYVDRAEEEGRIAVDRETQPLNNHVELEVAERNNS